MRRRPQTESVLHSFFKVSSKVLIITLKRIGERTEPWGEPFSLSLKSD